MAATQTADLYEGGGIVEEAREARAPKKRFKPSKHNCELADEENSEETQHAPQVRADENKKSAPQVQTEVHEKIEQRLFIARAKTKAKENTKRANSTNRRAHGRNMFSVVTHAAVRGWRGVPKICAYTRTTRRHDDKNAIHCRAMETPHAEDTPRRLGSSAYRCTNISETERRATKQL